MTDLTILVNTSDSFEDCWGPFFTLFEKFWPDCPYEIVLNTEHKDFKFDNLNIRCSKVANGVTRRLTWSECLARCLDDIKTPYIFYLQEDYFLEKNVDKENFEAMVDLLRNNTADVIRVMECEGSGPWTPTENPLIWEVDKNAKYRIALQAGLWRKSTLRQSIRLHESPWQLEGFGSARARRRKERVFCVNRDRFSTPETEIFPYTPTGVVAGRWDEAIVVPLFKKHGIEMDFTKRGFYNKKIHIRKKAAFIKRLVDRVRSLV